MNDFRLTPCHGYTLLWWVIPTNTAALLWMLCHTTTEQRHQTVAVLSDPELAAFVMDAKRDGHTIDDTTPPPCRVEMSPNTVNCLNCGKAIDYRAGTCPHCGYVEFTERRTPCPTR
ncbi:MAG TPA: hypothetical protein VFY05_04680 [Candidatus Angelobacter sp.]|nr:hypothetical protein [Candidatus Angelobacter sp.]